jgi:hypothetical protein
MIRIKLKLRKERKLTQLILMYIRTFLGPNYTLENGKLGTHRNKIFMSAVQGYGGLCIVGTADGDLLQFRG